MGVWVKNGIYLGAKNYGGLKNIDKKSVLHIFSVNGAEYNYKVDTGEDFFINNRLMVGRKYLLKISRNTVIEAHEQCVYNQQKNISPIKYTSGQRTLKNFLAIALQAVGTTLYVYGGGWNWQDSGGGNPSTTIGISQGWVDFFSSQNEDYEYKTNIPQTSYYPYDGFNQYYYAGLDCSGYVGWSLYNTFNTENGGRGYVFSSTVMAKKLAYEFGLGVWRQDINSEADFKAGDIVSIKGHIWICLGVCDDKSLVILHSTPSPSVSNKLGGGVQISAVGKHSKCDAYEIASSYMKKYYPFWSQRYKAVFKKYSRYTDFTGEFEGTFSWHLNKTGLLDPEGFSKRQAEDILSDLFGENTFY